MRRGVKSRRWICPAPPQTQSLTQYRLLHLSGRNCDLHSFLWGRTITGFYLFDISLHYEAVKSHKMQECLLSDWLQLVEKSFRFIVPVTNQWGCVPWRGCLVGMRRGSLSSSLLLRASSSSLWLFFSAFCPVCLPWEGRSWVFTFSDKLSASLKTL